MHVMQISFFVDRERRSPERLLQDWYALEDIAAAVASAGERVTVVQASNVEGSVTKRGVDFLFMAPDAPTGLLARSPTFRSRLHGIAPDVVHVHGLDFPRDVLALRELIPNVPILLQDHADRVPRFWRRATWRRAAVVVDGVSFCARAQIAPFVMAGMFPRQVRLFEIPELTTRFGPGDAAVARAATGLHGDPAVLWVGHLDRNKDPLTVLDGVARAVADLPGLALWCCFGSAPLLPSIEARIANDPALRGRVHLLGRVPHEQIEQLMRAADLFVLGSHREGGNCSLVEALATGLPPIVTDIPSSRALLGQGAVGVFWPPGDSTALAYALRAAAAARGPGARAEVRAHFESHLSSAALGRRLSAAYRELMTPSSIAAARVRA